MSSCSFCGGLVLKPDTAYGINPSAVCKCPHPHVEKPSDPQPLQTIEKYVMQMWMPTDGDPNGKQVLVDAVEVKHLRSLIEWVIGSDNPGETNVMIAMEHAEQRKRLTSIMKGTE